MKNDITLRLTELTWNEKGVILKYFKIQFCGIGYLGLQNLCVMGHLELERKQFVQYVHCNYLLNAMPLFPLKFYKVTFL